MALKRLIKRHVQRTLKLNTKIMINVNKYVHSLVEVNIVKKTGTVRINNSINLSTCSHTVFLVNKVLLHCRVADKMHSVCEN